MWVGTGVLSVWWRRVRGGMGVGWQVRLDGGIEGGLGSGEGGFVLAQGGCFFWDGLPMYPICTSAIFLIHSFLLCRRIIPISTFAICIFTLLFPVNIRIFFCYYTPHSFFCWVPHDSEPPISFSWCLHVLVLMGRGGYSPM